MLSRYVPQRTIAALPRATAAARSLSTTRTLSAGHKPAQRVNPLIGEIKQTPKPAVSTERPRATQVPSPSRAPVSSAEVPPNSDLPPPPPPSQSASTEESREAARAADQQRRYDARSPILNLADLIGKSAERYVDAIEQPTSNLRVHTRPITGRTVFLEHAGRGSAASKSGVSATSVQHAFQVLNRTVKDQKIKTLWHRQRFHERKGMKRKRLRMERWRTRFRTGFKATTSRVLELKKQGW